MLFCTANSFAQSFTVDGINYNITDATKKTVEVGNNSYNGNLTEVTIPNKVYDEDGDEYSVTSIGYGAFSYCSGLTSIDIPESVTSIGDCAFFYCSSLTSIDIPESVTSIGDGAFEYCLKLTSIKIPESITSIGEGAFWNCSSLTSIDIPESVTSIGESAFASCSSLTSIDIPESVTSIGDGAFSGCENLTSIKVDKNNTVYESPEGSNAIIETLTNTLIAGCNSTIIPNTITSIGDKAFKDCSSLEYIDIPESVTSIGEGAFYDCSSLTSIDIPESVTSIGVYAFYGCENLTSIDIPESVTSIGKLAFNDCFNLTSIKLNWEDDDILAFNSDWEIDLTNVTLYVPKGKVESYNEKGWVNCVEYIEMNKVTLSVNDEKYGKIKGDVNVIPNTTEIYTAIPNDGYHFVKWSDGNKDNPREIEVTKDLELEAIFEKDVPTAIKAVEAENNKTIKTIKDGQIVIIRNGVMYDMQGRKL